MYKKQLNFFLNKSKNKSKNYLKESNMIYLETIKLIEAIKISGSKKKIVRVN